MFTDSCVRVLTNY